MEQKELIEEIIEIVHGIAEHKKFSSRSEKRDAIIRIRNNIIDLGKGDKPLETVVIYLNGFIEGLCH